MGIIIFKKRVCIRKQPHCAELIKVQETDICSVNYLQILEAKERVGICSTFPEGTVI